MQSRCHNPQLIETFDDASQAGGWRQEIRVSVKRPVMLQFSGALAIVPPPFLRIVLHTNQQAYGVACIFRCIWFYMRDSK